jgi:hypothetical protein
MFRSQQALGVFVEHQMSTITTCSSSMDAPSISKLYPDGEMNQAPLATPLSGPKVVVPSADFERGFDWPLSSINETYPSTAVHRRKHESYTLTGSVFLIAGNGKTLKLPAPSDSPADPLGWGRWKRAGVFVTVSWFTIVALAVVQAAGLFMSEISQEFDVNVCAAHELVVNDQSTNRGR